MSWLNNDIFMACGFWQPYESLHNIFIVRKPRRRVFDFTGRTGYIESDRIRETEESGSVGSSAKKGGNKGVAP